MLPPVGQLLTNKIQCAYIIQELWGPPKSWNRGRGRGLLNRGKWPWTVLNRGKSPRFFSVHDGCFHDLGCLLKSGNN